LEVNNALVSHDMPNVWIRPVTDPAALYSDLHLATFQNWNESRGGNTVPGIEALDPLSMPRRILPHMIVVQPLPDDGTYKIQLVGTKLADAIGRDITGVVIRPKDGFQGAVHRFKWLQENHQPYFAVAPLTFTHRDYKTYNTLTLPFANSEGEVVRIVSVIEFTPYDQIAHHLKPFLAQV
jgi:hypothetical protein